MTVDAVMLTLALLSLSCAREESFQKKGQPTSSPEPTPPPAALRLESPAPAEAAAGGVNPDLPQRLRVVHEAADNADSSEEKSHAAEVLLKVFQQTEGEPSPHLISVRQDLAARAAALMLETSPDKAKAAAKQGLALSTAPTILRANLLLALADAEEALGDEEQAKTALVLALRINEELFESEMKSP